VNRPIARRVPGDLLLHPAAIAAVALLVVNDHLLKAAWPGPLTGKLSDLAGLAFFPLLLVALWELALRRQRSTTVLAGAVVATGATFASVQLWEPAAEVYRWGLGIMQWPAQAGFSIISGASVGGPRPVMLVMDPADLLALPALLVAVAVERSISATYRSPRRRACR
jgi:hypothetical protein